MEQYALSTNDPVIADDSDGDAVLQAVDNTPSLSAAQIRKLGEDFGTWLKPLVTPLRRYAYFLCKDAEVSRDLVQSAATNLFRLWHLDERRERIKNTSGYAFRAVHNTFLDLYKVPSRTSQFEQEFLEEEQNIRPDHGLDLETIWTIRDAIRQLDGDARLMVYLVYYQGDNVSAAGRAIGLNDPNQAHRLHKSALAKLRSLMKMSQE